MTPRKTPTKAVDGEHWRGRLENARAFHQAVRDAVALADPEANANPMPSNIVNAAIAYADALTAKLKHVVNQRALRGLRPPEPPLRLVFQGTES